MANSKLGFMVSAIFLSLMIFHGTFSAQGRPLKLDIKEQVTTHKNIIEEIAKVAEYTATWHRHTLEFEASTAPETRNPQYDMVTNDFQPTDPGHSPGAGHSSPHANIVSISKP
ncbi:LOW QUALITY PROTEIN: precursor of CEP1 [Glycine max]|uniref:LOW QUALITY PROTEIN: precursor of CEP1 n=1 Tax=Glycine max TaxID=3847 RepID=UPI000E21C14A|nr:LOW QUALITY PROTEIN: precursor of CEP1 [Glycine max]|eukprot:XP_025984116.1 LOW QUALITY PROTEIN: precursor of CEP1 [Glycine max]